MKVEDRGRMAREIRVSMHSIYTVASDLRAHGYNIPSTSTEAKSIADDYDGPGAQEQYESLQPVPVECIMHDKFIRC